MELYINGVKAYQGMQVETFRGEPVTLLSWSAPGTPSGGASGRVFVEYEDGNRREFYASVVDGKFCD